MQKNIRNVEQLLPIVRALLAKELVSKHGYRQNKVSQLLDITPSAVTQYLKGRRGRLFKTLASMKGVNLVISDSARLLSQGVPEELRHIQILEVAHHVLSVLKGTEILTGTHIPKNKRNVPGKWSNILEERLRDELRAAQRSLEAADISNDDMAKTLFREIATDSMRHADIVSLLITKLESGTKAEFDSEMIRAVNEMISLEDGTSEKPLATLIKSPHPAVRALLESVDADEVKHLSMLKHLLTVTKN